MKNNLKLLTLFSFFVLTATYSACTPPVDEDGLFFGLKGAFNSLLESNGVKRTITYKKLEMTASYQCTCQKATLDKKNELDAKLASALLNFGSFPSSARQSEIPQTYSSTRSLGHMFLGDFVPK